MSVDYRMLLWIASLRKISRIGKMLLAANRSVAALNYPDKIFRDIAPRSILSCSNKAYSMSSGRRTAPDQRSCGSKSAEVDCHEKLTEISDAANAGIKSRFSDLTREAISTNGIGYDSDRDKFLGHHIVWKNCGRETGRSKLASVDPASHSSAALQLSLGLDHSPRLGASFARRSSQALARGRGGGAVLEASR